MKTAQRQKDLLHQVWKYFTELFLHVCSQWIIRSLCGLDINVTVTSKNRTGNIFSLSILLNNLKCIGINSLKLLQKSVLKPLAAGLPLSGKH